MMSSRDGRFLVEAKWESRRSGVPHCDDLRVRVEEVGRQVVGVLATVAGIAEGVAERLVRYREKALIVVLDEVDIRRILRDPYELSDLLAFKREQLEMFGRVHLGAHGDSRPRRKRREDQELPDSARELVATDGRPISAVAGPGNISPTVFTLDLPDIDWEFSSGFGVSLGVPLGSRTEDELLDALHRLNESGWLSRHTHWTIQKTGRAWHGVGARTFAIALPAWRDRMAVGGSDRYTESINLFDKIEGGWFSITADLSCDESRRTQRAHLDFHLPGVPVDQGPLHQLVKQFGVALRGYYRPLSQKAVIKYSVPPPRPKLEVLGFVTEQGSDGIWMVGVVAKNPFAGAATDQAPPGWPWELDDSGVLVCALRSHHPASEIKDSYELWSWESATSTDSTVIKITAEW